MGGWVGGFDWLTKNRGYCCWGYNVKVLSFFCDTVSEFGVWWLEGLDAGGGQTM